MADFAISAVARKSQATANGSTTQFSFAFSVNVEADIAVFVNTTQKTISTHYTVSITANTGAGSITFTSGNTPSSGQIVTIMSKTALARASVYTSGGTINAAALEGDFDTNMMLFQQQDERLDRTLSAPVNDAASINMTLPDKDARKGAVLGFNATSGNPEAGPKIADVETLSAVTANIARLGTSTAVADMAILATDAIVADMAILATDAIVADMAILATDAIVADMAILGTTDVVADMNALATSDIISDLNTLATSDIVTDMNLLATSTNVAAMAKLGVDAVVADMAILGTTAIVADLAILGTTDVVSDMNTLATSDIVSDMNTLATSGNVTAMGLLGTSAVVTDMGLLGTAAVVEDMSILGTAAVVEDLGILATSAIVADMAILATDAIVADMAILGTNDVVADMAILATSDIVTDMNLLATSAVIEDMNLLATSAVISDMSTLAGSGANPNITTVTASGVVAAGSLDISGDIDVDGTANLDVVDIDGAVNMATTALVTGVLTANGGAVFNEASADVDFRVESNGNANMLFVDGGDNHVNIGTATDLGGLLNVAGDILLSTSGNPSMTVKTSGAGNNPSYALRAGDNTVFDIAGIFSANPDYLRIGKGTGGSVDTDLLQIYVGGDVEVSNGNLVIGTDGKGIDFSAQTASSASGNLILAGLPFTSSNNARATASLRFYSLVTDKIINNFTQNGTHINLQTYNGSGNGGQHANVTHTVFAASGDEIGGTLVYHVD